MIAERHLLLLTASVLLLGSFALALVLGRVALRRRDIVPLVDFPGGTLAHRVAVPLVGGLVLWLTVVLTLAAAATFVVVARSWLPEAINRYVDGLWYRSGELVLVLGLATALMIAGLLADLFGGGWKTWVVVQVVAATLLVLGGVRVSLFWPINDPRVGGLVSIVWVVALVNAFAFLDNLDGLASGVGLIASALFAATQAQVGSLFAPAVLVVVAGTLAGTWVFSRYPARFFLGRGGTWFLGFLLGAMTIAGTYYRYGAHENPNSVLSPVLVMAVPFYESAVVLLLWLGERGQPEGFDLRHYSYRLLEIGVSPAQAVWLLMLVSLGAGLGSLLLSRLDRFGTLVLLLQTACLIGVVGVVELNAIRRGQARRRKIESPTPSCD
jgi:UDP-GlcNAc:undecaprenyl-phosphate GlcNAc-1-phosphate transferase